MQELRITLLLPMTALRVMTAPDVTAGQGRRRGLADAAAAAPVAAEGRGRVPAWHADAAAVPGCSDEFASGYSQT